MFERREPKLQIAKESNMKNTPKLKQFISPYLLHDDQKVLFRPAQTTMPSRPLKKEIRTRKFLKGASIYKQVYAKKADIVSIGEYAEVRQANHTATETHETSRKCITSEIKAHLF